MLVNWGLWPVLQQSKRHSNRQSDAPVLWTYHEVRLHDGRQLEEPMCMCRFDIIANDGQRKLSALALCVLLHLQMAPLLQRLELLFSHITSVWAEVCDPHYLSIRVLGTVE